MFRSTKTIGLFVLAAFLLTVMAGMAAPTVSVRARVDAAVVAASQAVAAFKITNRPTSLTGEQIVLFLPNYPGFGESTTLKLKAALPIAKPGGLTKLASLVKETAGGSTYTLTQVQLNLIATFWDIE